MLFSKEILKGIVSTCEAKLKKSLQPIEVDSIIRHIKSLNPHLIDEYARMDTSLKTMNEFICNTYVDKLKEPEAYDVKEMMKAQMDSAVEPDANKFRIEGFSSGDILDDPATLRNITRILNRDSLMRDVNILIDSRYQNASNQDRSKIAFNIVSETKNKSEGSGTIIASSYLKDVVEIEIYPFSIPFFTDADNYYKKMTLSILELSASSIDAYENSQFHFIFDIEKRYNLLYLTPINKIFKFHKPISRIGEFTIRFGSPLATLTFEKDRLQTKTINYSVNPMTIEFYEIHNLLSGDLIYFSDFETLNNAKDLEIISQVTTPKGHTCSRIDSKTISINIDGSLVQFPDLSRSFVIYLGSKRILIPMRVRYMET